MSKFTCPVVRITKSGRHPNADNLSIFNGPQGPIVYTTGPIADGSLAVFVPRDSIVDVTRPEFSFLKDRSKEEKIRIKPIKLRGIPSVGLLVPCPDGLHEGDDASIALGVTKWEPPQLHSFNTGANAVSGPRVDGLEVYDVENYWNIDNFQSFDGRLKSDSQLTWHITEKIHGCNMKVTRHNGEVFIGSKTRWVADDGKNPWSQAWRSFGHGFKGSFLDDYVVFGECYGTVQDLHYGVEGNKFIIFDLYDKKNATFLSSAEISGHVPIEFRVPVIDTKYSTLDEAIQYAKERLAAEPMSVLDKNTIKEGLVLRPHFGEYYVKCRGGIQRLIVKVISDRYHQRHNGTEFQ